MRVAVSQEPTTTERSTVTFERILVPVDGSPIAGKALEFAIERAKQHGTNVTVAFAVNRLAVSVATATPYAHVDVTPLLEALDAEAKAVLAATGSVLRAAGVAPECAKLDGPAGPAILAYARRTKPGLIIMGTHGRHGFERLALGSTAEEVVRTAPSPVFVVPQGAAEAIHRGPLRHLLVAFDGSPAADEALSLACELARREGCQLTLCTVVEDVGMAHLDDIDRDLFLRSQIEERARPLLEEGRSRASAEGLNVETDLRQGSAAVEIVTSARHAGADAIVVGTHGRAGLPRFILGSVAEGVLRSSPLPVCTVRHR